MATAVLRPFPTPPGRPAPPAPPTPPTGDRQLSVASAVLELPGGRRLGYAWHGPRDGRPVVYLHGAVGTPLRPDPAMLDTLVRRHVRLLLPSRPGFGRSDVAPGRRVADWPGDLLALADALRLERFSLIGVSAGGPYALACARELPAERLRRTLVTGCVAPVLGAGAAAPGSLVLRGGRAALRRPDLARRVGDRLATLVQRHPGLLGASLAWRASAADRRLLDAGERAQIVQAALEATERGIGPFLDDLGLVLRPWGFEPESVAGEVLLVHGGQDATVPPAHARDLARRLPRGSLRLLAGEGHFFFRARFGELLGLLLEPAGG